MLAFNILEIRFSILPEISLHEKCAQEAKGLHSTHAHELSRKSWGHMYKNRILFRTFGTKFFQTGVGFLSFFLMGFFSRSRLCWRISGFWALTGSFITDRVVRRHIMAFRGFCLTTVCAEVLCHLFWIRWICVFFIIDNRKLTTFFLLRLDS